MSTLAQRRATARSRLLSFPRLESLDLHVPGWAVTGFGVWAATRLALVALYVVAKTLATYWGRRGHATLLQWDTGWYLGIAAHGYTSATRANFFPLFPALEAIAGRVLAAGHTPSAHQLLIAGLVVANLGTLAAFCGLAALVEHEDGRPAATGTVRLLAAYPLAFFLAVAYTDGLFLAAAVLAFLAVRRERWWLGALAALAAGLLRPVAPLLAVPLLWELGRRVREGGYRQPLQLAGPLAAVAAAPLGTAAYAAYLWRRFGDPLLFVHTQARVWHHQFAWPWQTLAIAWQHLQGGPASLTPLDLGLAVAFIAIAVLAVTRVPFAYALYTGILVWSLLSSPIPVEKDPIHSTGRYLLAAFPAFWLVGRWTASRPNLQYALAIPGAMLQAALAVAFVLGGPLY